MSFGVMTGRPATFSRAVLTATALVAVLGVAGAASADPFSLRDSLFGHHRADRPTTAPPVARYISENGDGFTLDLTQPRPLLKFDGSPEVWALQPQPAPRGDIIYKNDLGEPVLRATRLGGVTVFTPGRPAGSAAALSGDGAPLRLTPLGPQQLLERLAQASARASRVARRLISFDADASPQSSAVIADAAMVTSEALIRLAHRADARMLMPKVRAVRLVEGRKPAAQLRQGILLVTVDPGGGLAGRPSSERIVAVAASSR
jgi:hypothetical protein